MLSLKLVDLSGLDSMRTRTTTTLETQLQVVGVSPEGGGGYMPKEVLDAEAERRRARESRRLAKAIASEKDRQVRLDSVARDLELGLPVSIQQPDGEEFPRKCSMQLRSYDQQAEIVKGFIQGPPNKTICNSSDWGSGLEVKGQSRSASKSNSCSCLLSGQQHPQPFLNFLKPSSSSVCSSSGASGKSSPPHSRSANCYVHSRPSSTKGSPSASKGSKDSKGGSPSVSTHSSLSTLPTTLASIQPHKPTFTEKLQNMFSDKSNQPNNNSSLGGGGGGFARLLSDETKSKSSSSKSSKSKSQSSSTFGKIKDFKKFSNLPPTEAQVYAVTIRSHSEEGTTGGVGGNGKIGAGKMSMSSLIGGGTGSSDRVGGPLSFQVSERSRPPEPSGGGRFESLMTGGPRFESDSVGSTRFEHCRDYGPPAAVHMRSDESSDRNGNERERAYSDSMLRHRTSLPDSSSDLSQSRMSLCYEGEDSPQAQEWINAGPQAGNPTTEPQGSPAADPQGSPSSSNCSGTGAELNSEHDPTSFLYQHIQQSHHPSPPSLPSSMIVSQTPPPPPPNA